MNKIKNRECLFCGNEVMEDSAILIRSFIFKDNQNIKLSNKKPNSIIHNVCWELFMKPQKLKIEDPPYQPIPEFPDPFFIIPCYRYLPLYKTITDNKTNVEDNFILINKKDEQELYK